MKKEEMENKLIEVYQKWIQPKVNSKNFPILTEEHILKKKQKMEWENKFKEEFLKHPNTEKKEFERLFEKEYGRKPVSLISKEEWFLISDMGEKDVSNIHYSFGFEEGKDNEYWVEIALNSVDSVEQFLSMDVEEIKKMFALCKSKPPRMILRLTEKRKKNHAGKTYHTTIIEREMCNLTEQDINIIRIKANEINNKRDALDKPFVGLCVVDYLKKEELAENFKQMEDVFEFLKKVVPRKQRYKNALKLIEMLEKRIKEIEGRMPTLKKEAIFWKKLGKFSEQENREKEIINLEQELQDINKTIKNNQELKKSIEKDTNKHE